MEQPFITPGLLQPLSSLVLASLIVMGSPGPATISVTAMGGAFGFRRSVPYLAGIILGTSAVLFVVAAGLVSILLSQPNLAPALFILSALYILYLAFKIAVAPPLSEMDSQKLAPAFAGGFFLAIANPKAYVAIAAVFAGAELGLASATSEAWVKIAVLTVMIVLIHLCWLVAGAALSRALRRPLISRIVNLIFAAVLVGTTLMAILPLI
jgi:threonine/homoserine/homoserine lactone efflux protein